MRSLVSSRRRTPLHAARGVEWRAACSTAFSRRLFLHFVDAGGKGKGKEEEEDARKQVTKKLFSEGGAILPARASPVSGAVPKMFLRLTYSEMPSAAREEQHRFPSIHSPLISAHENFYLDY